jgi:hypothetical protein
LKKSNIQTSNDQNRKRAIHWFARVYERRKDLNGILDRYLEAGSSCNCAECQFQNTQTQVNNEYLLNPRQTAMIALIAVNKSILHHGMRGTGAEY